MPTAQDEATLSSNELAVMRTDLGLYRNLLAVFLLVSIVAGLF